MCGSACSGGKSELSKLHGSSLASSTDTAGSSFPEAVSGTRGGALRTEKVISKD